MSRQQIQATAARRVGSDAVPLAWLVVTALASVLPTATAAADVAAGGSTLIMGLGPALFAVVVLALAFSVICVVGVASGRKMVTVGCVLLLASVMTLFFVSVNVESPQAAAATKRQYNRMAITRSAIAAILISSTVLALFSVLLLHVVTPRQGRWVGERTHPLDRPRLV